MIAKSVLVSLLSLSCSLNTAIVSSDDGFGRLFTDPAQRTILDKIRAGILAKKGIISVVKGNQPISKKVKSRRYYSVKGMVKRDDGKNQIWINEQTVSSQPSANKPYSVKQNSDGTYSVDIQIPGESGTIKLKPGQTYLLDSGKTVETYDLQAHDKSK